MPSTQIHPGTPIEAAFHKRGFEPRQAMQADAGLSWGVDKYDPNVEGEIQAGMIATVVDGDVARLADSAVNNGRFRGVFFTEANDYIKDYTTPAPPTVMASMGAGRGLVRNIALVEDEDYEANDGFVKVGTGPNKGRLVNYGSAPAAGQPRDLVGKVEKVLVEGLIVHFYQPTI